MCKSRESVGVKIFSLSQVGLLDVGGSGEKPARVLHTALTGGVYSLCWGSDMKLFAVGGDKLVVYDALRPDASSYIVLLVVLTSF